VVDLVAVSSPDAPRLPPGPGGLQVRDVFEWAFRPVDFLERNRRRYGASFTVRALPARPPIVWLGEPDAVRDVFAAGDDVLRAGAAKGYSRGVLRRHSLLLLDGEAHRRQRRLLATAFHSSRMLDCISLMRSAATDAIAGWPADGEVQLQAELQAIALEVILRALFGVRGALHDRLARLLRPLVEGGASAWLFALASVVGSSRLAAVAGAAALPFRSLPAPLARAIPGGRLPHLVAQIDELLYAELTARRAVADLGARHDVLSLLLAARDEAGRPMGDDELRDELMTLVLAGHETTALTLAWAFEQLLAAPEALARLRAELATLPEGEARPDALLSLVYLDAVVKETMRLTPVVPLVGRVVQRAATFGRYRVPAGYMVAPSTWLVHHRDDLYPEPERFRPERFLARTPAPHEYFPFGGGLRRCIGAAFATVEIKVVLAEVLCRVALAPVAPPARLVRRGIMFAPSGPLRVRVRPLSA
jgi:cytochrome P450